MSSQEVSPRYIDAVTEAEKYFLAQGYIDIEFELLDDRYFSIIYLVKVRGEVDRGVDEFVLKIGKTGRSGELEYLQYKNLNDLGIRTLSPLSYNSKFNYLITIKEDICPISRYIKKANKKEVAKVADKFGKFINEIQSNFPESIQFDPSDCVESSRKRVGRIKSIGYKSGATVMSEIERLASSLSNGLHPCSLFSDFAFGNMHLDSKENIVLVDLGDARISPLAESIAYIYLVCLFIYPSSPASRRKKKWVYSQICKNIDLKEVSNDSVRFFVVKHLLNMIDFAEKQLDLDVGIKKVARRIYNYTYIRDMRSELLVSRNYIDQ